MFQRVVAERSTDEEAALWRALFVSALTECEHQFEVLAHSNPTRTAQPSHAAVQMVATITVRSLKAVGLLLEQGWYPESRSPVRTAWEATVDLAYLMQWAPAAMRRGACAPRTCSVIGARRTSLSFGSGSRSTATTKPSAPTGGTRA